MPEESVIHEIVQPGENLDVYFHTNHDTGSYVSTHWHNEIEIIYITSGTLSVTVNQRQYEMAADDCILINSRVFHSTHCKKENTAVILQIPTDFLNRYLPNSDAYYFDLRLHSDDVHVQTKQMQFKKLLYDMEVVQTIRPEAGNLRFTSLLFELLFQLYHNFSVRIGSTQPQQDYKSLQKLEPALQYANRHYREPISIPEIAAVVHLQPQYFCRRFKQIMGITFLDYLNEIRLCYVYNDLLYTRLPLYELLEKHGFTNYRTFRRMFAQRFGCTPRELRRGQEGEAPPLGDGAAAD